MHPSSDTLRQHPLASPASLHPFCTADVYVHVERPGSGGTAAGESPLPTALAAAVAAAGAPGMEMAVPLDNLASPFRTMRTATGAPALPPGCDRVALLPYPNAATSCQLNSVDINPGRGWGCMRKGMGMWCRNRGGGCVSVEFVHGPWLGDAGQGVLVYVSLGGV